MNAPLSPLKLVALELAGMSSDLRRSNDEAAIKAKVRELFCARLKTQDSIQTLDADWFVAECLHTTYRGTVQARFDVPAVFLMKRDGDEFVVAGKYGNTSQAFHAYRSFVFGGDAA